MTEQSAAERSFQDFIAGRTVSRDKIVEIIENTGCPVQNLNSVRFGYFRKVVADFNSTSGSRHIAKIGFDPHSTEALETEFRGLAAAGRIPSAVDRFSGDRSVLISEFVPGRPGGRRDFLKPPLSPFESAGRQLPATDFLASLHEGEIESFRISSLSRLENILPNVLPISPSHGDFIYWNTIYDTGKRTVVDFEAYRDGRIAGYDLWYWYLLPVVRRAARFGKAKLGAQLLAKAMPIMWRHKISKSDIRFLGEEYAPHPMWAVTSVLTLVEHGRQMAVENELAGIVQLIGEQSLSQRRLVCSAYGQLIDRILEQF